MQQAESGALWRAAAVLLVVSAVRWGWASRAGPPAPAGESVLPELLASTREGAAEGERRAEPLADGERIDPNRASEVELDRLPGVGRSTARAIVQARDEGTVFRRPEDLGAVRGIGEATIARLRASLDLSSPPLGRAPPRARSPGSSAGPSAGTGSRARAPVADGVIDLNAASTDELQTLPGVGPALAQRIVEARREQMFMSLDDLTRVRGIGPATVERLRPFAAAGRIR
jgi:competence protein ComEA